VNASAQTRLARLGALTGGLALFVAADIAGALGGGLLRLMGLRRDDLVAQLDARGIRLPMLAFPAAKCVAAEMRLRGLGHDLAQKGGAEFPAYLSRRIRGGAAAARGQTTGPTGP